MTGFDCNCFVGNWPFHKVRRNSFEAIRELHQKNGIGGGFVSSLEAIFYNDPWEADADLHQAMEGAEGYHHVITVNPMLPGCIASIHRAVKLWGICGVRLCPGFQGYHLLDPKVKEVCDVIRSYDLILFLTLRMEDERNTYLMHPRGITLDEVRDFCHVNPAMKIIMCGAWNGDMAYMASRLEPTSDIYWDCSAMRSGMFVVDDLYKAGIADRLLYGSMAPIFVLKSTRLLVETARVPEDVKESILNCSKIKEKGWIA